MISTRNMAWDPKARKLTIEASDLGNGEPRFVRVSQESCDIGLPVFSHWTSKVEWFVVEHEDRDPDGDVWSWRLKPLNKKLNVTLTIVND